MIEIRKTEKYAQWLDGLRDINVRARIQIRVERLAAGNAGDVKPVGEGVSSCESIMAQVTGFISHSAGASW
jgi:putative addiction module killer protein